MPETDLALLIDAARASGDIARKFFKEDPQIWDKPDAAGPVTEADLKVNDYLHKRLAQARPDYGWLSEETEDTADRLKTDRQFVIDPIDGTRAFIEGSPDWAHSLAIVENGQVISAAVYLPIRDQMFAASLGGGAMMNGSPISVAESVAIDQAVVLGAKPNFLPRHWRNGIPPPVKRAFRSSLAYRLCLVAQGRFNGMLTLHPSWEWDIAAGALIVTEAGGIASDPASKPLRFNNPHPQVPGILAASPTLHHELVTQLTLA